jgi:hypothetical protein
MKHCRVYGRAACRAPPFSCPEHNHLIEGLRAANSPIRIRQLAASTDATWNV